MKVIKATTLLERQHQDLQLLCETVELATPSIRQPLLSQLAGDLSAHFAVEEQLFDPAACRALQDPACLRHVAACRAQLMDLVEQATRACSIVEFGWVMTQLKTAVALHAREHERIFPQVDQELEQSTESDLSERMLALYRRNVEAGLVSMPVEGGRPRVAIS